MGVRAILQTLPIKIKADVENDILHKYLARCARMVTENTAAMTSGKYITVEYEDIINPKPEEKRSADDIICGLKEKIENMK